MEATQEQLNALFPEPPSPLHTGIAPGVFQKPLLQPGWTHNSRKAVVKALKDNHHRFHIFFNDRGFHNHASHHLLAIYAMGANSELIEAAYGTHTIYQRPAFAPPEGEKISTIINESNWKDYMGDERYYQAYLAFFSALLTEKPDSIKPVLEKYVFSKEANLVPGKKGELPSMLCRFLGGLLHPLIHAAYGAEFSLPGLVAEGIAQAALHQTDALQIFPDSLFSDNSFAALAAQLDSLVLSVTANPVPNVHALEILERISKDSFYAPKALGLPTPPGVLTLSSDQIIVAGDGALMKYVNEWAAEISHPTAGTLKTKYEEIVWMNTVIYGVGGWVGRKQSADENKHFNADFASMHLVTSALLLPSLLDLLSPSSAAALLRTYFALSLIVYISRGRAPFPVADFYAAVAEFPRGPNPPPEFAPNTLPPQNNPNPWHQIIQTTLVHPDEHLCKLQRALLHFAQLYGGTAPGTFAKGGFETLDGTLFVRVAGLTADRLGWMREGQKLRGWDRSGFYKEELF